MSLGSTLGQELASESLAGEWQGYWVGDLEVRLFVEIESEGDELRARSIWWTRMPRETALLAWESDGAERLQDLGLPRHAWLGTVDFAVVPEDSAVSFRKTGGTNLYPVVAEAPEQEFSMSGIYRAPGLIVDDDPGGSMLLLWQSGQLEPAPLDLEKSRTHKLRCLDNGAWGYRVYVPESYDPATPTPVLMNASPNRNALPLSPKLAEELGWIMIGLTERENRKRDVERRNRAAVLFDLRRRFNVDWARLYTAGFSGGARSAALTAVKYPEFCAGVICIGAGYAYDGTGRPEVPPHETPVAFIIGENDDLCYGEVTRMYPREKVVRPCTLIVHPGGHDWARPEDHEAAIRWLAGLHQSAEGTEWRREPSSYVSPEEAVGSRHDISDTLGTPAGERATTKGYSTEGTCRRPRHVYPQ